MSIRLKLQLPLIAIMASLLVMVSALHYFWLPNVDEAATAQIEAKTVKQMQVIATSIAAPLESGNMALIDDNLRLMQRQYPHWIEITLRNNDGVRLYPLFGTPQNPKDHAFVHQVGDGIAYRQSVHLTLPIIGTDDKRIGYLQVSVDDHELEQVEHYTILEAQIGLAVLMLLVLLGGLLVQDRWVTKPIRLLVMATQRLAKGQYDTALSTASKDEIGQLAISFDRMRHKVHRREQSLIKARTEAERLRDTYAALSSLNSFIAERPAPAALFRRAGEIIQQSLRPDFLWIARVDWQALRLHSEVVSPQPEQPEELAHIEQAIAAIRIDASSESNVFQRLLLSAEVQCLPDIFKTPALGAWPFLLKEFGIRSLALAPIMRQNRVEAIVAIFSARDEVCEQAKLKLFGELAERIGLSLEDYAKEQELQRNALYDPMTHLPNRTLFMGRLTELRAKALVHRQSSPFAIGILDLMGLKSINDRLGHNSGDRVVNEAARRLETFRQGEDLVARLSGDEFGLILYPRAGDPHWHDTLKRLLNDLGTPLTLPEGEIVNIQAHIGLAQCPGDGRHPESLLRRADLALHEAKLGEDSGYCFFHPKMEEQMLNRHRVQREFLESIHACHLVLHYQPQMDVASCRVIGFEALIRWPLANGGHRPANEFIGLVEADGRLIRSLGRYVLEQALSQLTTWRAQGFETTVSINIGARHLLAPEFLEDVDTALRKHPVSRTALKLEITETAYLSDLEKTAEVLAACRARGLKIALDDFGTGYASLSYLQRLPCDQIKIDQSFIRQLLDNPQNQAIVAALITAARLLDIEIIAEGVETAEHALRLLEMGCLLAQGYAAARPMPPEAVIDWTRQQQPNQTLPEWAHHAATPRDCRLLAIATEHHLSACLSCEHAEGMAFGDISIAGQGLSVCRFEYWYAAEGLALFGEHPDFDRLGEAHALTHKTEGLACETCQQAEDGCEHAVTPAAMADIRDAQRAFFELFWSVVGSSETGITTRSAGGTAPKDPSQALRNLRERAIAWCDIHQGPDRDTTE
ncbi:hypothetical protein BI364_05470 [Acidihalobacter yilgarnensis]|uniref:Diguanylate cyclase n=1 Tax=Acidihalobacter yilgarnensis TaxID=2819280 RepID=A0A1D8IM14_9GAMM|nr:EAL domain-containing protein [Acidihalobacter yilgarnensis]AOU97495.1 hypothetical protein BI364_05470 [Acidihalobacter yilgarnensis]